MTSDDNKQEEEEFEDIQSEVEGDASEVGNASAQEKFEKLKKVVKESSKEESKKSKKENKKEEEKEERKKEDNKQEKKKRKEEKKRRKRTPSPSPPPSSSSSSSSSSSENGDDDDEYYGTRIPKRTIKPKSKHKAKNGYKSVSFNYDSLDTKSKDDVTIPVRKLPQFDGTNFAKWKHMMKAYLTGLSLELWNIVCVGFDDLEDFRSLTPSDCRNIRRYAQATNILVSILNAQEYNRVDKVKKSKINILMAELNRFTIFDGEGPQEMFDRLMVIVGKIRGLGGDELDDHFVVKVMLEAFAPRNPTLVTLIREKRFEEFSPNDVLGRILTHELMEKEIQHRKKIGELENKLNNLKVKEIAPFPQVKQALLFI
jgi:hypothetical protein